MVSKACDQEILCLILVGPFEFLCVELLLALFGTCKVLFLSSLLMGLFENKFDIHRWEVLYSILGIPFEFVFVLNCCVHYLAYVKAQFLSYYVCPISFFLIMDLHMRMYIKNKFDIHYWTHLLLAITFWIKNESQAIPTIAVSLATSLVVAPYLLIRNY